MPWGLRGWIVAAVFLALVAGFIIWSHVLYARDANPQGFWRVFVPQFYAGLAGVGIAAAIGIPSAFAVNHFWAQHQQAEIMAGRRTDAARLLLGVRDEVAAIQTRAVLVPSQLDNTRTTGGLHPLQATLSARLETAAFEALQRGDYLNQVGEHGLDRALTTLYHQVGTANSLIEQWSNVHLQSRPEDRDSNLQGLMPMLNFYSDSAQRQATTLLQQIDATVRQLQQ